MLTDLQLRKFKPKGGRQILWDSDGFGILIGKRRRTFFYRYSFNGKRKLMTLGQYPVISLQEAHKEAAEARLKVKRGIDPGAEIKDAKAARKAAPTIAEAIKELYDEELINKRSGKETLRILSYDVIPHWGSLKVADITRRDIKLLLNKVKARAPITANRVYSALSRLFGYCVEGGIIDNSPFTHVKKPVKEIPKSRVLTDTELKLLWDGLSPTNKAVDIYRGTKLALKLIILTGCRPGEIVGMRWDEINDGVLTIPAKRMKGAEIHRVPLTNMAVEVIEEARALSGDSPFIFRSPHKDSAPLTAGALSRAILRHRAEMKIEDPFTPHDLRRTLRTRLAELGIQDVVAERVLAHKLQGILKVYNRYDYDKEKREALTQWENRLRVIVGEVTI